MCVCVFFPSVFRWDKGGASIEGIDEATIGLLDEHRLSVHDLGKRYCTSLKPNRPEQSAGMNADRATQVCIAVFFRLVVVVVVCCCCCCCCC